MTSQSLDTIGSRHTNLDSGSEATNGAPVDEAPNDVTATDSETPPGQNDDTQWQRLYAAPRPLPDYVPPASGLIQLRVGCEFTYSSEWPTPAIVQVEPHQDAAHRILSESWETVPAVPSHQYTDVYGNRCRRLTVPPGEFTMRYDARIEVSAYPDEVDAGAQQQPIDELPDGTIFYTLASRYCLSDALSDTAWKLFGQTPPGWARVQAICDWCHNNIRYESGCSTPLTTALDVFNNRQGICRDFAHIGVTFCRAMNIPARYCFGYFPDIGVVAPPVAMDFHAWFEAYLDGRWRTFDARHNIPRIGRVTIARGRDAVDCAMITTYGGATLQTMKVWCDEAEPQAE